MNIIDTSDYKSILTDKTFRHTAARLVYKCGVRADLKGSDWLIEAVILYGTGSCSGFSEIYRVIGEQHDMNPKSVMRSISYTIDQAFDLPARLGALIGIELTYNDIHCSLVIAYLGKLFACPDGSIFA